MNRPLYILLFSTFTWLNGISQPWARQESLYRKFLLECRYDSALYYADEAAAIFRGTNGEKDAQYCFMLRNLAYSHFYLGNYIKSKYFILREAELWESLRKTNDPEYINCLKISSVICRKSGCYEEALVQIKKADKKATEIYKPDSQEYADLLNNYAGVYHDFGFSVNDMVYINQEEKYLKKAESIYSKFGKKAINDEIINKTDQAALNNNIGNSPKAEQLLQNVVELSKKAYGNESPGFASALNNLAVLYYNTGNYKLAEKFFVDAVSVYKRSPAAEKIQTGICLNNLGALYYQVGNYKVASDLISESRKIIEYDSQQGNPVYSVILNNLASVSISEEYYASKEYKNKDRLSGSGKLLMMADSVFRLNCQKPHPYYQAITCNLAIWYNLTGNKKKSVQLLTDMSFDSNLSLRVVALMNKMSISGQLPSSPYRNSGSEPVIIPIRINLIDQVSASNM
jgi:hypothetical protein